MTTSEKTGLSAIIENLKQLPEDGFRVWEPLYTHFSWLPYLTVLYPVQIGLVGEVHISVKPVGDVADILWNRYPDREAAMNALIEAGGHMRVKNDSSLLPALDALCNLGLAKGSGNSNGYTVTLLTPTEFLTKYPDFNRPATEPPKGAGNAPLDRSKVKAITQINAFHFANKDYARLITEGQVRVYISELQEITNAYEQAPNPGYYTLKLWNFRTNSPETMELWQHSGRVLTCYWLTEPPEGEGVIKTAKRPEKEFPDAANWKTPPPARPVAVTPHDLALAVRNLCSNQSGGVNETKLFHFIVEVLGDQKPAASHDPQPLIEALEAIAAGAVGDYTPAQIAQQAIYTYLTGQVIR